MKRIENGKWKMLLQRSKEGIQNAKCKIQNWGQERAERARKGRKSREGIP
ncbi:MAG: hypothetical protein IKD05_08685 [Tidjanibacter sp.]|nr:hypothetical protein [Tidjanibacter sp.]